MEMAVSSVLLLGVIAGLGVIAFALSQHRRLTNEEFGDALKFGCLFCVLVVVLGGLAAAMFFS